MQDFK